LAEHLVDRQAICAAARGRFATILGLPVPAATNAGPDLSGPRFELVLAGHMKGREQYRHPTGVSVFTHDACSAKVLTARVRVATTVEHRGPATKEQYR